MNSLKLCHRRILILSVTWTVITFISSEAFAQLEPDYSDDPSVLDIKDRISDAGYSKHSEGFGVSISPMSTEYSITHKDFHLPLNGPDIVLSRQHIPEATESQRFESQPAEIFDWALDIPKVFINYWRDTQFSVLSGCNINQVKNFQVSVPGVDSVDITRQVLFPITKEVNQFRLIFLVLFSLLSSLFST